MLLNRACILNIFCAHITKLCVANCSDNTVKGWDRSSLVKHLSSMHETRIPSPVLQTKPKKTNHQVRDSPLLWLIPKEIPDGFNVKP